MSTRYGLKTVTNGLEFYLDSENPKCYSGAGSSCYDLVRPTDKRGLLYSAVYSTIDKSWYFNGSTNRIVMEKVNIAPGTGSFSMSSWIKLAANHEMTQCIAGSNFNSGGDDISGYGLGIFNNGIDAMFFLAESRANWTSANTKNLNMSPGIWYNIVGIRTYGSYPKIYINGELNITGSVETLNISTTISNMVVGNGLGNIYPLTEVYLKSIQYYNRILNPSEIKENYEIIRSKIEERSGVIGP